MRAETEVSLLRIGAELGGRDHSTVLHACDKIDREMQENEDLRRELAAVRELIYAGVSGPTWVASRASGRDRLRGRFQQRRRHPGPGLPAGHPDGITDARSRRCWSGARAAHGGEVVSPRAASSGAHRRRRRAAWRWHVAARRAVARIRDGWSPTPGCRRRSSRTTCPRGEPALRTGHRVPDRAHHMVANTGTYVDTPRTDMPTAGPRRRCRSSAWSTWTAWWWMSGAPTVGPSGRGVPAVRRRGRAVLVLTGWSRHFGTPGVPRRAPVPDRRGRRAHLVAAGAALVGIDSLNIDDTAGGERPAHSALLAAGIPICEHLTRPRRAAHHAASGSAPRRGASRAWAPSRCGWAPCRPTREPSTGAARRTCSIQRLMDGQMMRMCCMGVPGRCRVDRALRTDGITTRQLTARSPVPPRSDRRGRTATAPRESLLRGPTCRIPAVEPPAAPLGGRAPDADRSPSRWDGGAAVIIDQRQLPGTLVHWRLSTVDAVDRGHPDARGPGRARHRHHGRLWRGHGPHRGWVTSRRASAARRSSTRLTVAHRHRAADRGQPRGGRAPRRTRGGRRRPATARGHRRRQRSPRRRPSTRRTAAAATAIGRHGRSGAGGRAPAPDPLQHGPAGHGRRRHRARHHLRQARGAGELDEVIACETRPLLQGGRLTAWELGQAGVPVPAHRGWRGGRAPWPAGMVDAVVVGCDRVAAERRHRQQGRHLRPRGARRAPWHPVLRGGAADLVRRRDAGRRPHRHRGARPRPRCAASAARPTTPADAPVWNPAFDVTPAALITAFITEAGVLRPPYRGRPSPTALAGRREATDA